MTDNAIYQDIAKRTGGDIYIGVVGPVRTGKSTFIHRFLETAVLPRMTDEYEKARTEDQMPQSAAGKTVMTTEPKFIPEEGAKITLGENHDCRVRLIDCVGYLVDGALGGEEDGAERLVRTPWSEKPMPFAKAAAIGTDKVIEEHATIGLLMTTDGSFSDIPRENYVAAEEKLVGELKSIGKPFAILLNSSHPERKDTKALGESLEKKYGIPVALINADGLREEDIRGILTLILGEFPVKSLTFSVPSWLDVLPSDHPLSRGVFDTVSAFSEKVEKLGDVRRFAEEYPTLRLTSLRSEDGTADFDVELGEDAFTETLCEVSGKDLRDKHELLLTVKELTEARSEYEKVKRALDDVKEKGYGIVMPKPEDLVLDEPKTVKTAGGYGVKVSAHAESIHMIKAGIRADVAPVLGSKDQAEEVLRYLSETYEEDQSKIWDTNMLGKSLYDLMNDSLVAKLSNIPDDSREKLADTLERILNEGANGLICILL